MIYNVCTSGNHLIKWIWRNSTLTYPFQYVKYNNTNAIKSPIWIRTLGVDLFQLCVCGYRQLKCWLNRIRDMELLWFMVSFRRLGGIVLSKNHSYNFTFVWCLRIMVISQLQLKLFIENHGGNAKWQFSIHKQNMAVGVAIYGMGSNRLVIICRCV